MGNPLNSATFIRLADKRVTDCWEQEKKLRELKSMVNVLFNVASSDSAFEESFYVTGFPDIPEFNGKLTYLSAYPGSHKKVERKEFAGGVQAERNLMDDKKFGVFDSIGKGLARSYDRTREKYGVRVFNNATSSAFDFMTSEEGKPLASSTHLTKTGVSTSAGFDNTATAALSKTALAAARIKARKFKMDTGDRYEGGENIGIIVPDNLADTAREIVGSEKDPDSANNTINPHFNRYKVIPYMRMDDNDTNNWGIVDLDAMKDNLLWYDRIKPEPKSTVDFDTYALLYAIYGRFSYCWLDWRFILWSTVS